MSINLDQSLSKNSLSHSKDPVVRRGDWRFLLNNPLPRRSIVFGGGLLAEAVSMISESTAVSPPYYEPGHYDLAVAVNPSDEDLYKLSSALRTGGNCYIEWQVNNFFHTSTIIGRLETAGFADTRLYLPRPEPDDIYTDLWIPIASKGAVEFVLVESLNTETKSRRRRLAKLLRYLLWKIKPGLLIKYPYLLGARREYTIASIASKDHHGRAPYHAGEKRAAPGECFSDVNLYWTIKSALKKEWKNFGLSSRPEKVSKLMLCNEGSKDKIMFYVFADKNSTPSLVVKIPRTRKEISTVRAEARNLESIQTRFNGLNGIPKMLFCLGDGEVFAQAQSYVNGAPFSRVVNEDNRRNLSLEVTSWLVEFARSTALSAPPDWRESLVDPVISTLEPIFRSSFTPAELRETARMASMLSLSSLVCEHGDFSPWNILLDDKGNIGVIDWEVARLSGLPGADLVLFLTYLNFNFENAWERRNFGESYSSMLDPETQSGVIFKECIELYSKELDLTEQDIHSIRLLTWLGQLYKRIRRYYKSPSGLELPLDLDEDMTLALWKVELEKSG